MPPEGEKKRGDTTGEGDKERREPLAEVRARDRRERELETNELGFRRYGAAGGAGLYPLLEPCQGRAGLFAVPCLGRASGPRWQPRHGTVAGPCQARARSRPGRAGPGPCFLVPCPCRPTVLVPFGKLYTCAPMLAQLTDLFLLAV